MAIQSTCQSTCARTFPLVASDQVAGTPVFRSDGETIGAIERLVIDKPTGKVAYAVVRTGEDCYPLPWSLLTYDPERDGYHADITGQQLTGAPKYAGNESWDWSSRECGQELHDYYNVPPYWGV